MGGPGSLSRQEHADEFDKSLGIRPLRGTFAVEACCAARAFFPQAVTKSSMATNPIIVVGHTALDRVYRIEAFPAKPTKVRALDHREEGGGSAANTAAAIAVLGGAVRLGAGSATTRRAPRRGARSSGRASMSAAFWSARGPRRRRLA